MSYIYWATYLTRRILVGLTLLLKVSLRGEKSLEISEAGSSSMSMSTMITITLIWRCQKWINFWQCIWQGVSDVIWIVSTLVWMCQVGPLWKGQWQRIQQDGQGQGRRGYRRPWEGCPQSIWGSRWYMRVTIIIRLIIVSMVSNSQMETLWRRIAKPPL